MILESSDVRKAQADGAQIKIKEEPPKRRKIIFLTMNYVPL
jgi:hypothetical protein